MARILVTSSRTPFALDAIRKLATAGHEVWAADVYASAPGSHSRYLAGHATLPSPEGDTPAFVDAVERLDGMVWNGQPIAGMSAADRAVLDQLER
jgi:hypothetical protein